MPECSYCGESFRDEEAYLEHLETTHADELSRIDQRRVDQASGDESSSTVVYLSVVFALAVAVMLGIVAVMGVPGPLGGPNDGGRTTAVDPAKTPYDIGSVHYHGSMVVEIDGQRIDFSQPEYQLQADAFHFEGGNGQRWHVHARGVTLQWALATLEIQVTDSTVTFKGTTYRDGEEGTEVSVTVNGDAVVPSEYVLQPGDQVRIVVQRG